MTDQFTEATADTRALDTLHITEPADAVAIVDDFAGRSGAGAWPKLDRAEVADRLRDIVTDHRAIDQGSLNLCGPASFTSMWCGRDPVAVARFAVDLFEHGRARIGDLEIEPHRDILTADPDAKPTGTWTADWMILGAIRNSEDAFWQGSWRGDPAQQVSGMTLPEEVAGWLKHTGIYSRVEERASWMLRVGLDHATSLDLSPGTDAALLINANMLTAARSLTATPPAKQPHSNFLLDLFPNHFVVALNTPSVAVADDPEIGALAGDVVLSVWTWGADRIDLVVPQHEFVENYFGAVVAHLA